MSTPAFAWALPDVETTSPAKAPATPKAVSNPFLERSTPTSAANAKKPAVAITNGNNRIPFSPMENNGKNTLRQRRKAANIPKQSLTEATAGSIVLSESSVERQTTNQMLLWENTTSSASKIDSFACWVLVYGFTSNSQLSDLIRKFTSFGVVKSQRSASSNWIAFLYESHIEAEKALTQDVCLISGKTVVGVSRLDAKLAKALDWDAAPTVFCSTTTGTGGDKGKNAKRELGEADILARPEKRGRKSSICEKFLGLLFGWDDVQ